MEKNWIKNYPEGVPETINPDAFASINELFIKSCDKYSNKNAYTNMGVFYTYKEIDRLSRVFASYLQNDLGLVKGDRIAIMMPNLLQYPVAMFGALRAGLIVVSTNPLYTSKELSEIIKDSGAKAIVILENFASTLQPIYKDTDLKHIIVTKISDVFNFPKSMLVDVVVKFVKKMVPSYSIPNHIKYRDVMNSGNENNFSEEKIIGSDIAYLQYTGGTTGKSKGAVLTHSNLVANLEQAASWLEQGIDEGQEIIITALPLYHIFSLTANCLTFMRFGALNVLITNPRDIPAFVIELSKFKFTAITGVNTLFNALLNNEAFTKLDFSSLKLTLGGGMAVQSIVASRWQNVTKRPLLEAYGLTETSPAVCINPMTLNSFSGSIGLPIPSTEISIRDDKDQELGFNQAGELLVRGPQVMRGYWNQEEETNKVLTADGWLRTGDIATVDEEGYVKIVDRKKDMILVSGFNIYPNEIEDVIAEVEGVVEVAVIGIPDEIKGELAKAFIVRNNTQLSEEVIINHCRSQLTAYKIPKLIEFRDELPKSNVGKILRRALR
ncbi:MAG: AMP-binding protein [Francisellaceae bacterium]|jgi:long-chain acyl-CoA synthetase|nr:AMP-binding protein [Francisellaceae bacterium]MBT6207512.1 AMP-binding protein [Francisellaceae bacterium]MBT6538830.1 AMP-binding protein [Francisellaceae bacterium]